MHLSVSSRVSPIEADTDSARIQQISHISMQILTSFCLGNDRLFVEALVLKALRNSMALHANVIQ